MMVTGILIGVLLALVLLAFPKILRVLWFVGFTLAVWAFVVFALLVIRDMTHG
jgi:hypothetical protein